MAQINRQVAASADDCYRRLAPDHFSLTDSRNYCGDLDATTYDLRAGMRFLDITIPKDATIDSAYLKLYAITLEGAIADTIIEGEDVASAVIFSTSTNYDGRARTSASVNWTPSAWVGDTWYTSEDIKSIIQEIVNRGDWASGNALVLFWRDAPGWGGVWNRLRAYSWNLNTALAPKLEVNYTPPVVAVGRSFGYIMG